MRTPWGGPTAVVAALALAATACRAAPREDETALVAHYASFEVVTGRPQRVLVGLSSSGGRLVAFGTVHFAFSYLGTRELHLPSPQRRGEATADFRPIPGQGPERPPPGPRVVPPSVARGVYGTDEARFETAGFWRVTVTATIGGRERRAEAAWDVTGQGRPSPAPGGQLLPIQGLMPTFATRAATP